MKIKSNRKYSELIIIFMIFIMIVINMRYIYCQLSQYSISTNEYDYIAEKAFSVSTITKSLNDIRNGKLNISESNMPLEQNQPSSNILSRVKTEKLISYSVDFKYLSDVNKDVAAWITIPGTKCNYPVVQGLDNSEYLNKTFNGTKNASGSIFIDSINKNDFSDMNTILYGHNMKNGSMFHILNNYKDSSFYEENPLIYIITPDEQKAYRVISAFKTSPDSFVYTTDFDSQRLYCDFLSEILKSAIYSTVSCDTSKPVITLSTCTGINGSERFVVVVQEI